MQLSPKSRSRLADLGLFYAAVVWGSTFFVVKDTLSAVDPVVLVAYRFLLAGLCLLGFLVASGRSVTRHLGRGALLAVILWFLYVPQTLGLKYTTASNSGFITGLFVVFVPVFLRLLFKRRPTVMEVTASGVALVGLWFLTGGLAQLNRGDALTLLAAMTYALHVLYSDRYAKGGVDPYVICCQQFLLVGLLSLITALVAGLPLGIATTKAAGTVAFLAFFPTLSAFVVQLLAQRITAPVKVSLIFAFEPVFAALFAWTLGGEVFRWQSGVGGLCVFAALVIAGLRPPVRTRLP